MSKEKDINKVQLYYPPEDVRFLGVETFNFDGPRKLIQQLDNEQMGRLNLYITVDDEGEEESRKALSYTLKINNVDKNHLVIFADGNMLATKCNDPYSDDDKNLYSSYFFADSRPVEFTNIKTPLELFVHIKNSPEEFGAKVTHSSDNPAHHEAISGFFGKAMNIVQETRERRVEGQLLTDKLIKNAGSIFENDIDKRSDHRNK